MIKAPKRPAVRYHGGKWMLAPWIISHFPAHRVYVEPFGGGGSVLLRKARSYGEIYNDLDGEIVNLFRVLRDNPDPLIRAIELTPFARDEFRQAYEPCEEPVERARRTMVKASMGFGSAAITATSPRKQWFRATRGTPTKDNPAKGWEIPVKVKPAAEPIISPIEVLAAIEAETDPRHKAWVWTLWETGMRPSEATRTGAGNLVKVEGIGWWIDVPGTKTDAAARSVPISEELAQTLLDLGEPWFPYTRRRWTELWHRLQETQGLRAKRTRKKRTPGKELPRLYAIRKARVTAWGDMGLSDAVWANIVGHEDVALTRKVYDTVSRNRIASQMGLKEKE